MTLNLEQRRGEPSVWDQAGRSERDVERWLAAIASGVCLLTGVRRRSIGGLMLALGGSGLAWWAAGGLDERQLRRTQAKHTLGRRQASAGDVVNEAGRESFPASDPPSWTPTSGPAPTKAGARPQNR